MYPIHKTVSVRKNITRDNIINIIVINNINTLFNSIGHLYIYTSKCRVITGSRRA